MPTPPQISDSEWNVMKIVWESGPLTAGQIVQRMQGQTDWHPRTIKTLLSRLVKKGPVAMEEDGRRYLYRPKVTREACRRYEARSFLSRVFDGALAPLRYTSSSNLTSHAKNSRS